jgi:hypothetical protein
MIILALISVFCAGACCGFAYMWYVLDKIRKELYKNNN